MLTPRMPWVDTTIYYVSNPLFSIVIPIFSNSTLISATSGSTTRPLPNTDAMVFFNKNRPQERSSSRTSEEREDYSFFMEEGGKDIRYDPLITIIFWEVLATRSVHEWYLLSKDSSQNSTKLRILFKSQFIYSLMRNLVELARTFISVTILSCKFHVHTISSLFGGTRWSHIFDVSIYDFTIPTMQ